MDLNISWKEKINEELYILMYLKGKLDSAIQSKLQTMIEGSRNLESISYWLEVRK